MDLFGEVRTAKRRGVIIRDLPPVPVTNWHAPTEPPNLDAAVILGIDTETHEFDDLPTVGPGWGRHRGEIVGVSIAAQDRLGNRGKWYFPIRHSVEPYDNLDPALVMPWVAQQMARSIPKVGANIMYDCGWLQEEGCPVNGPLHDIQFAEAIIDNNARVSLDKIAMKYLKVGKTDEVLEQWIMAAYKTTPKTAWRKDIWRTPPRLVGPYAEDDADLPLRIIPMQWDIIARENLGVIYDLEHGLIPLLINMRMNGVPVNVERAHLIADELKDQIEAEYLAIERDFGMLLDSTDTRQVAKLLDKLSVTYPRTKADGPSIQKPWLEGLEHPIGDRINDLREMEKIKGTFLESYIIEKNINGLLYPNFHPLRGEVNGTLLGRFASSGPNLQNIPSRTSLGARVRSCFIPFEGHVAWRKHDYSQLHYRILADIAVDLGDGSADRLRQSYIDDPRLDYHMGVYRAAAPLLHWPENYVYNAEGKIIADEQPKEIKTKRRPIKNVNFGLIYGQGETSLAYKAGFAKADATTFFNAYHTAAPYVKPTMQAIAFEAKIKSYVTTLLGRKIRFDKWEPMDRKRGRNAEEIIPLPHDIAVQKWGSMIELAFLYRAVNYKIQGTEPDIMKTAMLTCYRSGVFNVTGYPMITVHDELDWSKREHSRLQDEAYAYIVHVMETTTRLRVPLIVDAKEAIDWGEAG